MTHRRDVHSPKPEAIAAHYASGYEADRLHRGAGQLDRERSRELVSRFLPPAPAAILDVGGGPGGHACWLAVQGYQVHLIDITPLHVELARLASGRQPEAPLASAEVGDARALAWGSGTADAVVMFGPLYHLTDRADRVQALREAHRVLRPGGVLLAAAISRFASALDGLCRGFLKDPQFAEIVRRDLTDGQHRNPTGRPEYFMDTFFHHPDELRAEVADAGFGAASVYGVEGPGWLLSDFEAWWDDGECRGRLLQLARALEAEPSLSGVSAHLMAVVTR
ncbi:MAG TPA: methyltransferase domain-containing protein [Gemmataceae bacterium]|nr:methyltransferase domain-containing protein [Gemmataceae bacterium]